MPPSDPSASFRRLSRKRDDMTDIKRARGEMSCAECRRLKLKCDKKIPCGSCARRGCPSLCPNSTLSTSAGSKYAIADNSQLRARMLEMGKRIRQLEDALAILQSSVSSEPHPLLREELLTINFGPDEDSTLNHEGSGDENDTVDALGMLTIGDRGAKYYGPSAGTEALFMAGAEMDMSAVENDEIPRVPKEISNLSRFPFGANSETTGSSLDAILLNHLPPQPRAWTLYETYVEHASWIFGPIKRDEMIDEFLSPIYKAIKETQTTGPRSIQSISPHRSAVLFFLLALGALVDLTLESYNAESETYYHLGCACLSLRSVFDSPEVYTVQAVVLMAAFQNWGGDGKHTMDGAWTVMSLGAKLAQSIGLHRDGSRFNLDPKIVERRRHLFWEIFSCDVYFSISLGRPPSLRLSYVDCEFPEDDQATLNEEGKVCTGFYRWKFEFAKEIFASVAEVTLAAKSPTYQSILDLDRKLREKTLPAHLSAFVGNEHCSPSQYIYQCMLPHYRAATMVLIHKTFFVKAMVDHPINPLRSAYAPSFLATYRCASGIIKASLRHFEMLPNLCPRAWSMWTALFPAAIIVGCIVTRSPSSDVAPSAFAELKIVCDLFEKGVKHSRRARDGLAILSKLKAKAEKVYSRFQTGDPFSNAIFLSGRKPEHEGDVLALFGGQTRVIASKLLSNRSRNGILPASSSSGQSGSEHDSALLSAAPDVHPALMEYLSMIPLDSSPNPPQSLGFDHQHNIAAFSTLGQHPVAQENQNTQFSWQSPDPTQAPNDPPSQDAPFMTPFAPFVPQSEFVTQSDQLDPGMTITLDSSMESQWLSFMRDEGLLE